MSEWVSFWAGVGITLVGTGVLLVLLSFTMRKRTIVKTHPILDSTKDAGIFNTVEEVRSDCSGNSESG